MFFIQYTPHLIACIFSVTGVLSAPQLQDSANPGMGGSQEGDLNTLSLNQGDLIASQPDSNTPSGHSFNEIGNILQTSTLSSNIGQPNSFSNPVIEPNIIPLSQDSALVPFDENGGLTNVIQSFPSFPQLNIFPQGGDPDPQIPPDTQTNSPTEREEPDCKDEKFAFCCQQGPPARGPNKVGILSPEVLLERERERKSRLGNCKKCEIRLSTFITLVSVIVLLVVCFLNKKNLIRYPGRVRGALKGARTIQYVVFQKMRLAVHVYPRYNLFLYNDTKIPFTIQPKKTLTFAITTATIGFLLLQPPRDNVPTPPHSPPPPRSKSIRARHPRCYGTKT